MSESVLFKWNFNEFESLVDACSRDDGVQLSLKFLPKDKICLEAGCGTGRAVKYLTDLGYNVEGIELNPDVVKEVNQKHPYLKIKIGDILRIQCPENHYYGIMSYGVIEHFQNGLQEPLKEMYRVLAPGGVAIVTVPSFNFIRRIKYFCERYLNPKTKTFIRKLFNKEIINRNKDGFAHHVYPQFGEFFEYRLKPREFESQLKQAGFKIIMSCPIAHMDGVYWEFGRHVCRFENWKFYPSILARLLNSIFKLIPFCHNHMHACIVTK